MKSVLITGAGGGLGGATADLFAARGWEVFAADLEPPQPSERIFPIALDVTDEASCAAAAEGVRQRVHGLDAVVNFAGVLELGPLIEIDPDRMRRSLEINLLGTFQVNQAVFPLIQAASGRIINISSEAGVAKPQPLSGPYSVSKHAVEAYSDVLRRELQFLGIKVVTIEPGPFRTPMSGAITERFAATTRPGSQFESLVQRVARIAARSESAAQPAEVLAQAVWIAVTTPKPRVRYLVGAKNVHKLLDALPDRVIDMIVHRALR